MNFSGKVIIKEGYLDKKSRHIGSWRRRWTVLSQETIQNENYYYLSTYKTEKVHESPTERIRIDQNTEIQEYHKLFGPIFYIQNSEQIFIFKPSTYSLREEWMQIIYDPMLTKNLFITVIRSNVDRVIKMGYLYKQNECTNELIKLWTVLYEQKTAETNNKYCYYMYTFQKRKNYRLHTSKIKIDQKTQIKEINENQGESSFYIENIQQHQKRKIVFKAISKNERDEWIKCLFYDISRDFNNIFVKGFIRQNAEKIPSEIQEIIYLFWGSYINYIIHSIDQPIDARNRSGKWFPATILYHKSPSESIPIDLKDQLTTKQEGEILRLRKLEALYVIFHFDDVNTNNWMNFNVGSDIDCKDPILNTWCSVQIMQYKKAGESVPMDVYEKLKTDRERFKNLEGLFVHFGHVCKWIFFEEDAICECNGECDIEKHRLCRPDTQSQIELDRNKFNYHNPRQHMWGRWIFLGDDTVCNLFCRGRECNNLRHQISKKAMDKQLRPKKPKDYNKLFVMAFIQQIEIEFSLFIVLEIKELIYLFWGEWVEYTVGSKVDVRNAKTMWLRGIINYYKPASCEIPSKLKYKLSTMQQRYLVKLRNLAALYIIFPFDEANKQRLKFKVGQEIDCRDDRNQWHLLIIKQYKKPYEPLPITVKLTNQQKKETDKILKLEGILVHFEQKFRSWNEWIFIDKTTICSCNGECNKPKHRLSAPNTQSQINDEGEWVFLQQNDTICNAYCRGRLCENMKHKLSKPTVIKSASHTNINYNRLLVMKFIQTIEIKHNLSISLNIKESIYMYWGSWIECKVGNKINARNVDGIWFGGIINYHKPRSQEIPSMLQHHLSAEQWENIERLSELEAIFVHFELDKKENNNWRNFQIGDSIDYRDCGDWHLSEVIQHKKASETIEINGKLSHKTKEEIEKLQKLQGLLVRYERWTDNYIENWIFIEEDTICECDKECGDEKHILSSPNTQSRINSYKKSVEFVGFLDIFLKSGKYVWGEWIFLQNDTICNCYCNGTLCTNFNHRLTKSN